jgi:hypothetical protein
MKNKLLLSTLSAVVLFMTSCGPGKNDAIQYNDQLISLQKSLSPSYNGFINQSDGHNKDSLKLMYASFCANSKKALDDCSKIQPFAGNSDYLNAALEYFKTINTMADNEGKNMTNVMLKDSTQITDSDIQTVKQAATKFDSESSRILQRVGDAQQVFSKQWKFEITNK